MQQHPRIFDYLKIRQYTALLGFSLLYFSASFAQGESPFRPFTWEWPSPNASRLATGAPGPLYWQQKANYNISVQLDEIRHRISGQENLTYFNYSPNTLSFIWLQLDQNIRKPDALAQQILSGEYHGEKQMDMPRLQPALSFNGGVQDFEVRLNGQLLPATIVETNARIDLPQSLRPGESISLDMTWNYAINDGRDGGRCGYEYFPEDGNYIYEIAQFYPRVCTYDELWGWENKPFMGDSEFGLEFGDFQLAIELPSDFLVAATGELQNPDEVLSKTQKSRLESLNTSIGEPKFIVTPAEALIAAKSKSKTRKTWRYKAENVRDMAFAASKKFVWDAAKIKLGGKEILTQAFYPKEGMPLWDKYANHAVIHTLQTYSKLTFDYPYPVATAVHGPVWGMEYPMLAFCGGRPTSSGYYSRQAKYRMIGVVIHEVGHNYFPMIVNSNERRWAWMDEGLNSFCQILAEESFEENFPLRRGSIDDIDALMIGNDHQAIMTNADDLRDNSSISYIKTAIGLNLLRNEILGPELFDQAFRAYALRWAFKHPEPADLFRTIEDLSGNELNWFWRTWFYENPNFEVGISKVAHGRVSPTLAKSAGNDPHIRQNFRLPPSTDYCAQHPNLKDRYSEQSFGKALSNERELKELLEMQKLKKDTSQAFHYYQVLISRTQAGILPTQLEVYLNDGNTLKYQIPAQVWQKGNTRFVKEIYAPKPILAIVLDPQQVFPDIDRSNNIFPRLRDNLTFEETTLRQ